MRDMRILLASVLLATVVSLTPAKAQLVTPEEAMMVAQNWVTLIVEKEGTWGGAEAASVKEMLDLKQGDRLLGYLFRIQPTGYIVVSLHKELPPVQAYSETGDLDPESDMQKEGIIKEQMAKALDGAEGLTRSKLSIQGQTLLDSSQVENRADWETFGSDSTSFAVSLQSGTLTVAYESEQVLLTSTWSQGWPYNRNCPGPGFGSTCQDERCDVGCTVLAGAQIMRYWAWPPSYDWANMPDSLTDASPEVQKEAVATLCRDVGDKAGAVYCVPGPWGCQTLCELVDNPLVIGDEDLMEAFIDDLSYHPDEDEEWRISESQAEWFDYFKEQLSHNRPVPYELGTGFHTIVCDGWREVSGMRQLHLNYGWGGTSNGWWTLDTQPENGSLENIIIGLCPKCVVGSTIEGRHEHVPRLFFIHAYAYFAEDVSPAWPFPPLFRPNDAEYINYNCQFLPGITLRTYPEADTWHHGVTVRFAGNEYGSTRLYSIKGNAAGAATASIKVENGAAMVIDRGGGLRFF